MTRTLLAVFAASSALLPAQHPSCNGNGVGAAYLATTNAPLGGTLEVQLGSANAAGGLAGLLVSDALGPSVVPDPRIGTICIDVTSPAFFADLYVLDGAGNATVTASIPAGATNLIGQPLYLTTLALEPGPTFSLSRTARIDWETGDGYRPVANTMQLARSMHRATALHRSPTDARNQVLVTGGGGGNFVAPVGTATTELYEPLTRSFAPGPAMNAPRAQHSATLLQDGRVLVCGGADTTGAGQASCEIYDPATNAWAAVTPMSAPRIGHGATRLADGRVLVTGGFATFQNGQTNFLAALNSAQDTAEIYDPSTDAWSPLPNMASARAGHQHVETGTGTVLVISGINGGFTVPIVGAAAPTYTDTVETFDPATNTWSAAPPLINGRGFYGVARLAGGIVVAGGNTAQGILGSSIPVDTVELLGAAGWSALTPMGTASSFGTMLARPDGTGTGFSWHGGIDNLTTLSATAAVTAHDLTAPTARAAIGTNSALPGAPAIPIGLHTATRLQNGSYLFVGGSNSTVPRNDAWTYQPR